MTLYWYNHSMDKRIGHIKTTYLELSETWFYSFLSNYERYDAFVTCEEVKNRDKFPFDHIYQITPPNPIEKAVGKVVRGFTFHHPAVEKKYKTALEVHEPSVIHAHWGPIGLYALPIAKELNKPLVTSFYGFDTTYKGVVDVMSLTTPLDKIDYWKRGYEKLFAEGDYFVTFGEQMRETVIALGCSPDKVEDVHSGVDVSDREFTIKSMPEDGRVILYMANRLVEKKGVRYVIEAMGMLKERYPNMVLRVIGDGPLKDELVQLAEQKGVAGNIEWLGMQPYDEFKAQFNKSHIFLTPSVKAKDGDEEGGINTTVIDALAYGTPTIASVESGSQLIYHQKTGLLAEPGNSEHLAEQLEYLFTHPDVWAEYAQAGLKVIEEDFSQKKQTEKMEAVYDRVAAEFYSS